ncbi:MAG: hypothetical protein ED559_03925 [Phycisphaera sp.]|nr:MAG: hypothetical protein ED559_03925 [Phycisphaera sp.]
MPSSRAFAASDWKLPVAGIFATGCIGLMIYQAIPSRSERTDKPKPSLVRADGTTPEPRQRRRQARPTNWETSEDDAGREYAFDSVKNANDVAEQMGTMTQVVSALNGDTQGEPGALGSRVAAFLEPINAGDQERLVSAVAQLGGSNEADEEGALPTDGIFTLFSGLLKYASLDTTNIQVREPTTSVAGQEGVSISMNRNIAEDPDTGEEVETASSIMTGAPVQLFPLAAVEGAKGKLIEVRLPFLSDGSKSDKPDIVVNLQMRNVPGAGWQPAGFVVDVRNEELMQSVMREMMSRRGG